MCTILLVNAAGEYSSAKRQKAVKPLTLYISQVNILLTGTSTGGSETMTKESLMRHLKRDRSLKSPQSRLLARTAGYMDKRIGKKVLRSTWHIEAVSTDGYGSS